MNDFLYLPYIVEIVNQCGFALLAEQDIMRGISEDRDEIKWYGIQNLLIAGAHISKILWPDKNKKKECRGVELRKYLGIDCSSYKYLKDRNMRNHFEHIDERLDSWAESSKQHNFMDLCSSSMACPPIDSEDRLRIFDNTTWKVAFWKHDYELKLLLKDIKSLQNSITIRNKC